MILTMVPEGSLLLIPLGISTTSHSRLRAIGSLVLLRGSPRLCARVQRLSSLCRYRFLFSCKRGVQRLPSQGGAFYAHRKFGNAGKNSQLSEFRLISIFRLSSHEPVEPLEETFRVGWCFALQALGHHRR